MDEYTFTDAIALSSVTCTYPGLETINVQHAESDTSCTSLFFPGCSFINYAMPLVQSVYDLLESAGQVNGISLLCCGKILDFEGDGGAARDAFDEQFLDHIQKTNVERIVAACPNCVSALRRLLAKRESTSNVEVVALPRVLADMGYRIDAEDAAAFARAQIGLPQDESIVFCPKDSCPDRTTGEFADALRELMSNTNLVEPKFARKRSYCCGSRPRAAGHYDLGDKMARRHGTHAHEVGANVLVTACISCTFSLWGSGCDVPAFHYLELLFNWNIPWQLSEGYLKLRFLFDDVETWRDVRDYKGLDV